MADYLEEDLQNPRGYVAKSGKPKGNMGARAMTENGIIIYGTNTGRLPTATYARLKLIAYDDEVERQRRLLCDTALAQLAIDNPDYALPAVRKVTAGIQTYWRALSDRLRDPEKFKAIVEGNKKYVYGPTSFGRLSANDLPPPSEVARFRAVIQGWVDTLTSDTYLPKLMSLQDMFLRIYESQGPADGSDKQASVAYQAMANLKKTLRPTWYEDPNLRGRVANPKFGGSSDWPGLLSGTFTIPMGDPLARSGLDLNNMAVENRNRGTDMFLINAAAMQPQFRRMLGQYNMPFSASASGTTSTLLTSGITFAPGSLSSAEEKRQYLLGCIAYLVGGGMHTCHEVFATGALVDLPYSTGKYIDMLPVTFTRSRNYPKWSDEFWDIIRPDRVSPR